MTLVCSTLDESGGVFLTHGSVFAGLLSDCVIKKKLITTIEGVFFIGVIRLDYKKKKARPCCSSTDGCSSVQPQAIEPLLAVYGMPYIQNKLFCIEAFIQISQVQKAFM